MIQPLKLTNREKFSQIQPDDTSAFEVEQDSDFSDSWLATSVSASAFDRQTLRRVVARQRTAYSQLALEWRALNRGTVTRLSNLTAGDLALSGFCLLLSVWILLIWQSDAPFWWVSGLSLFFGVAAVAHFTTQSGHTPITPSATSPPTAPITEPIEAPVQSAGTGRSYQRIVSK